MNLIEASRCLMALTFIKKKKDWSRISQILCLSWIVTDNTSYFPHILLYFIFWLRKRDESKGCSLWNPGRFSHFSDKVLEAKAFPWQSHRFCWEKTHMEIKAIHSLLSQNVSLDAVLESHLWSECWRCASGDIWYCFLSIPEQQLLK